MLTDRETARKLESSHQCADCGPRYALVTRWNGQARSLEVLCGNCHQGERFTRRLSVTAQWRADPESVPVHVANRLQDKFGGESMSERALTTITKDEMASRIAGARWMHQLTPEQQVTLAEIAVRYGYDPIMGEVTVYEGKIYVTLDGALRDAKRVPHFEGLQTTPLTQQEREARGIRQPIAYRCELYRADWRVAAVGIGVADPANPMRNNPVERSQPHALAEARAIRRAVRLAREAPSGLVRDDVDVETGEILPPVTTVQPEALAAPTNGQPHTEDPAPQPPVQIDAPAPPKPADSADRKRLWDRWGELYQEANSLGLEVEPLDAQADRDTIVARGKELLAAIQAAKAVKPF